MVLYNTSDVIIENGIQLIYKTAPFYMNIWFYIGCLAIILSLCGFAWLYFQYNIKNRTNFRIHMPDKKVHTFSFRNVLSEWHSFTYGDKDKYGKKIDHKHHIVSECVEYGFFGRYLDYMFGDTEPINHQKINKHDGFNKADFTKSMESYLNSETLSMLLLIGKLKDLLIGLLTIILIAVCVSTIIIVLIQILHKPEIVCNLTPTNQTINTIRIAIGK